MDHAVRSDGGLARAHVPPVAGRGGGIHRGEVAAGAPARSKEGVTLLAGGPCIPAIGRAVDEVSARAVEATATLVQSLDEDRAVGAEGAGHLDVSHEGELDQTLGPACAVIRVTH